MSFNHFELDVKVVDLMADFYARILGFVITDRVAEPAGLMFLGRGHYEHRLSVPDTGPGGMNDSRRLDRLSFRVGSPEDLRAFHVRTRAVRGHEPDTVCHGTTRSIHFRDPGHNRQELFTNTPWRVNQPCRFAIDLTFDDDALNAFVGERVKNLPGFQPAAGGQKARLSRKRGEIGNWADGSSFVRDQ